MSKAGSCINPPPPTIASMNPAIKDKRISEMITMEE